MNTIMYIRRNKPQDYKTVLIFTFLNLVKNFFYFFLRKKSFAKGDLTRLL